MIHSIITVSRFAVTVLRRTEMDLYISFAFQQVGMQLVKKYPKLIKAADVYAPLSRSSTTGRGLQRLRSPEGKIYLCQSVIFLPASNITVYPCTAATLIYGQWDNQQMDNNNQAMLL